MPRYIFRTFTTLIALFVTVLMPVHPTLNTVGSTTRTHSHVLITARDGAVGKLGADSRFADPNTIRSCEQAVRLGANACEFDLRLTRDHIWWLGHDKSVDSATNGHGLVAHLSAARMKRLRTHHGDHVPSYARFLRAMQTHSRLTLMVEIKNVHPSHHELKRLIHLTNRYGFAHRSIYTASQKHTLRGIYAESHQTARLGWITRTAARPSLLHVPNCVDYLMLDRQALTPSYVWFAHFMGLEVSARGAASRHQELALMKMGIDIDVTSNVRRALTAL